MRVLPARVVVRGEQCKARGEEPFPYARWRSQPVWLFGAVNFCTAPGWRHRHHRVSMSTESPPASQARTGRDRCRDLVAAATTRAIVSSVVFERRGGICPSRVSLFSLPLSAHYRANLATSRSGVGGKFAGRDPVVLRDDGYSHQPWSRVRRIVRARFFRGD